MKSINEVTTNPQIIPMGAYLFFGFLHGAYLKRGLFEGGGLKKLFR